ncbi:hypothetical protein ACKUB1_15515 [Methanospirillum stamsii]|nr:hypothetical protein [Methanospirillum stamsii]
MEDRRILFIKKISVNVRFLIIALSVIFFIPSGLAVTSEDKIIYDLPLFDNYGPAFATWSGGDVPLGTALLKGTVTFDKDNYNPGDKAKIKLDMAFSATIIAGENGALMDELGYDTWMLHTEDFLGFDVELGDIKGSEFMGIGKGQEIPPLMVRNVSHTYYYEIPDSVNPGTYNVYAFIDNSEYQTNPVRITINGDSGYTESSSFKEGLNGFSGMVISKNFDEENGEPIEISDTFLTTDERICAFVSFSPLLSESKLEWHWYDPTGYLFIEDYLQAEEGWDWACYYIDIQDYEKPMLPGEWKIDFLYDGEILGSQIFTYKEDIEK